MSHTQEPAPRPPAAADPSEEGDSFDPRAERVAAAVKAWQRHLVDLGGRNTLLWHRDLPSGTLDLTTAHPGGVAMLLAGRPTRLSDLVREPAALEEARRRARTIRAKTIELAEERGITAGFLAVGMATWQVPGGPRPPAAPVLLRSCVLRPTGAAQQDFAIDLGAEVEVNPVLAHYLRSEQGIEIGADDLAEMAVVSTGFDPHPVFAALRTACARVPGFMVSPRLVVGTFSYAKLPMVADLAAQQDRLADHDVIAALAGDPDALRAVRTTVPDPIADADPEREHLVLDADSSQQAVIDAVRAGSNLVIKGPPGTGKSQTIANLIAALASEGRRTLFVAEKRAAIDAVVGRLDRLGLGDLVLDAHDGATSRRRLARDIGATLERAGDVPLPQTREVERTLRERRAQLVEHATALHESRDPWGVSAYAAQTALADLSARARPPTSRVRLHGEALRSLTRDRVRDLSRSLAEAASLGAWKPGESHDPWYAARITTADEASRALEVTTTLSTGGLDDVRRTLEQLMSGCGLPAATRPADWAAALALMSGVSDTLEMFRPEVFDAALADLVAATGSGEYRRERSVDLGWWARQRLRREARALLRPGPPPSDLHASLERALGQRHTWQEKAGAGGRPEAPASLEEAGQAFEALAADLSWLGDRLRGTVAGGDLLGTGLDALQARLADLAGRADRLGVVPQVVTLLDRLRAAGMGGLVDDLAGRGVPVEHVPAEVDLVWWTSLLDEIAVRDPRYGAHDGSYLRSVAAEYIAADHAHLDLGADRVRAAVARRLQEALADHPDQEALVRAEAARSRRHLPLRELLTRAGEVLTAIKPCWAMSPLVVASLLPPGRWFDVVIFDEASQIPPAQAISAISRATQVVVAGDERQLPPTSFFTAATDPDAESAPETTPESLTEGFESVLDVLSATLPVRRLTWHYRSLDERLIAFANREMYDGSLVTFPGTTPEAVLRLDVVDGSSAVQPGGAAIESTQAEVERAVELVLDHARSRPTESLGVIALGIAHAARIEERLRVALADAPDVAGFFEPDIPERFFVKNLERVQGDERDAVILSVGYGKTPHGRVLHRFGPLNLEGGERRLNVAITRARRRMVVVSSFTAAELDPARLHARGALMLRDFLAYAASGGAAVTHGVVDSAAEGGTTTGRGPAGGERQPVAGRGPSGGERQPQRLVTELAHRLRADGLVVHEDYGSSTYRLDLAIDDPHHPGRPLVAVESDGPAYAAIHSTRDRDRLRVEQLRRLGWDHQRVWSTDLFRDPARDVARVTAAVWEASAQADASRPAGPERDHTPAATSTAAAGGPVAETGVHGEADPVVAAGPLVGADPLAAPDPAAPEQTRDDTDAGWGERIDDDAHDRWLREQRPPHWN